MSPRIALLVACFGLGVGTLGGARVFAANSSDEMNVYAPSSDSQPAPTELPGPNDCCTEWTATNFPIPSTSERGDHCPADEVPEGSDIVFGEKGRIEISFYDSGYGESRTFILDITDPACFATHAGRRKIFFELAGRISDSDGNFPAACERLRDAVRAGSLELGDDRLDLRPAQPYLAEVCKP